MKDKLTRGTKLLLDFMFYAGIAATATLPFTLGYYRRFNSYFERFYVLLCILFFLSGIFAVLIIGQLRRMFETVLAGDCFIRENVVSLRKMGSYSFCISAVTFFRLFMYWTPGVCVVILVFVIAGLFSKVLSQVFDKAVTYKLENDLTI